jgi:hypothetical protein
VRDAGHALTFPPGGAQHPAQHLSKSLNTFFRSDIARLMSRSTLLRSSPAYSINFPQFGQARVFPGFILPARSLNL